VSGLAGVGLLATQTTALLTSAPATTAWLHAASLRPAAATRPYKRFVLAMQDKDSDQGGGRRKGYEAGRDPELDGKIMGIALPALGALAIDPLLGVVDTIYVGRIVDAAPLAALGVCSSVFNFAFFIFNFFATATTPLVSRAIAANDRGKAIQTLGQAFTAALAIGLLSSTAIEAFAPTILSAMGTSTEAFSDAEGYLRVRALATPAVLLASVANGAFRGVQDTATPFKILVAANLINFVLDPLLIFGVDVGGMHLPGFGATGAAAATAVAEWSACLALLAALDKKEALAGSVKVLDSLPRWEEAEQLLRASGAVFVRSVTLQTVLTTATSEAARIGTVAVAAHQVALQMWLLLSFLVDALAVAAQTLVAEELGKGSVPRARQVSDRLIELSLGLGVVLFVSFMAAGSGLASSFSADAEVAAMAQHLLLYVALMQPLNALVFVGDGIGQGSDDFLFLCRAMLAAGAAALAALVLRDPSIDTVWQVAPTPTLHAQALTPGPGP
jgi:putative MATE family efflux protein